MAIKSQRWYRNSTHDARIKTVERIKAATRELRKVARGYDASRFNLRNVATIPKSRINALFSEVAKLHTLQSAPHRIVRPRAESSRKALQKFTASKLKGAKVFFVPVAAPTTTTVRVTRGKKPKVQTLRKLPSGRELVDVYYLFHRKIRSMEDAITLTEAMLPDMLEGRYMLYVHRFGAVAGTIAKSMLLKELRRMDEEYADFQGALRGFVYVGDTREKALKVYDTKETARERIRTARAKQKNRDRKRIQRLTGKKYRCKQCGKTFKTEKQALTHATFVHPET